MLPRHPYDGIIIVARVIEIEVCILGIGRVGEVSYPAGLVRVNGHYIRIKEVVFASKSARNGLAHNAAVIVNVGGVFGNGR